MEKFLVPQYIDVEPKILGPVTVRQFVEMLICAFINFVFYKMFYFNTFIVLALGNTAVFLIIAFYKINGMPFHYFILNMVQTMRKPRKRIWRRLDMSEIKKVEEKVKKKDIFIPKKPLGSSRLSNLSLLVDTGGAYQPEDIDKPEQPGKGGDSNQKTQNSQNISK